MIDKSEITLHNVKSLPRIPYRNVNPFKQLMVGLVIVIRQLFGTKKRTLFNIISSVFMVYLH